MNTPDPFYVRRMTGDSFLRHMLSLGEILEMSLVGVFEGKDKPGRGSRREMDLPLHRDGVFSAKLSEAQGGHYVEKPGIDFVGLYCLIGGMEPCYTLLGQDESDVLEIDLKQGEALVFDNHKVMHGRRGPVGNRVLIRVWVKGKS